MASNEREINLQTQVPERKQAVKCIFAIQIIIRPMAVETAGGVPEGVHKIQTALGFFLGEPHIQRGQRVEGGGGGEEVRYRCSGYGDEAALRMQADRAAIGRLRR